MSTKYPGGFITKSPVAPTSTAASGVWTLDQQQQYQKAGTWPSPPLFIEDLFSTYLYKGNGSTQTITNGIDLSGQGGLVWVKMRSNGSTTGHVLSDTARGASQKLDTSTTGASSNWTPYGISAFGSTGFTVADDGAGNYITNNSGVNYASWTFRKQPKFFDVVTYTGDGNNGRTIAHNLGSTPGFVIIKKTDSTGNWMCWHNSFASTDYIALNTTGAKNYAGSLTDIFQGVSSTTVTVGSNGVVNSSVNSYVMYLFAHNAGGFPASGSGSTNGISCGSYTGNGSASGPEIDLGYEPQFVMIKAAENVRTSPTDYNNWAMVDVMRGMPNPTVGTGYALAANLSEAEAGGYLSANSTVFPTATGFKINSGESMYNYNGCTYIYIAIRRGPMKTPTTGTSVFNPVSGSSPAPGYKSSNFNSGVDMAWEYYIPGYDDGTNAYPNMQSRLTGTGELQTPNKRTEISVAGTEWDYMNGFNDYSLNSDYGSWLFKRAPGFFDEVCYTGNGAARTITHNLGVAPELIIIKNRTNGGTLAPDWVARAVGLGNTSTLFLNLTDPAADYMSYMWNNANPTSTGFQLSVDNYMTNSSTGSTYVAYLFATCAGVSKVGSYTGTGALQTINCGFSGGARFVLIKRSDDTGDWYLYDTNRGMTSGNDPYILANSTAAQVSSTNYVDTDTTGFQVTAAAPAGLNANGGTYIFLAIA